MPRSKPAPAPVPVLTGPARSGRPKSAPVPKVPMPPRPDLVPTHRIRLNLTAPERQALREQAAREGLSMAALSYRVVLDYLKNSSDHAVDNVVRQR